jgi:hypothetical protein
VDVSDIRAHKDDLFSVCDLPVLCRRVPVADISPRKVEGDRLCLPWFQLDLVKAAQDAPGVVFAAQLDILDCVS